MNFEKTQISTIKRSNTTVSKFMPIQKTMEQSLLSNKRSLADVLGESLENVGKKKKKTEKNVLTRFVVANKHVTSIRRRITEYPDDWMRMRDIKEEEFDQYGIVFTDECSYKCKDIELPHRSDWTSYELENGVLPSIWWFHMGLNDHVNSLMMESDCGLANLFFVYEGHNIKTVSDNGSGYYWNESTLLWEEMAKNELRSKIGEFFQELFAKQVQWSMDNYSFLEHRLFHRFPEKTGTIYEEELSKLKSLNNELGQTKKILNKIGSWNGLAGISQFICANALDPEFEKVVNMSSTELPTYGGNVIDFKTLQVRPRCHSDFWSYELKCKYTPNLEVTDVNTAAITIQRWWHRRFVVGMLKTFCNDDIDLLSYLQSIFGVMCTREAVSLKKIFVFTGKTDTGKSETFKWIKHVLGQNFVPIGPEVLMESGKVQKGRCTTEMMDMPNARACVCSELGEQDVWNNNMVKRLTGGDPNPIRGLHKSQQMFVHRAVTVIHTNDIPKLKKLEDAMINRIENIPCIGKIVKSKANNRKCIRMLSSSSQNALFGWMAKGANIFLRRCALNSKPLVVKEANTSYFKDQDSVSTWIESMCTTGDMKHWTLQKDLYGPYTEFCEELGHPTMKKNNFLKQLRAIASNYGFIFKKSGDRKVFGLSIDTNNQVPANLQIQ